MPPKRKAPLAIADTNIDAPPMKKAAKEKTIAGGSTAERPKEAVKKFKYSNADSIEKGPPKICKVCWPVDEDDEDDESEDEEKEPKNDNKKDHGGKDGKGEGEPSIEVTDKGFPITQAGIEKFMHIISEQERRDQDLHGMHICNDWSGWGMTEVLENLLIDFNKILFQKDTSPYQKWAYVEGIITWLTVGDLFSLMTNENSAKIKEIFQMFPFMLINAYEMLSEHNLLTAPNSLIPNVGIMTLLLIAFLKDTAKDFDVERVEEIVRQADRMGVNIVCRKEVAVEDGDLERMRELCEIETEEMKFEWKSEWKKFAPNHKGGRHYDITRMSKAQRKSAEL